MRLNLYCDGGARGNPGPAALGVLVKDERGRNIVRIAKPVGVMTNNTAEYLAVAEGLRWLEGQKDGELKSVSSVSVYLDSKLIVNQLNGLYKVKSASLRQHLVTIRQLEAGVGVPICYILIPREKNRQADQLVNLALDTGSVHIWSLAKNKQKPS